MSTEFKVDTRPFCYCGRLATQVINGVNFCGRHKTLGKEAERIPKYSGKSKSINKFNNYQ